MDANRSLKNVISFNLKSPKPSGLSVLVLSYPVLSVSPDNRWQWISLNWTR